MSFTSALDKLKESFLVAAAQGGSSQDCESLLEMGANINWKGQEGDTPILAACRRGTCDANAVLRKCNAIHACIYVYMYILILGE